MALTCGGAAGNTLQSADSVGLPARWRLGTRSGAEGLYGASIGVGMLAEGHMLAQGGGAWEMALARNQVIMASGADGPGVTGMLCRPAEHPPWRHGSLPVGLGRCAGRPVV